MGRTGQKQDTAASATDTAQQGAAFNTAQTGVNQYNANIATLEKGGQVAANPWQSPAYLSNVNRLQSGALNANKNATDEQLSALNRRTGGMNNTAAYGAIRDTGLQTARLADQLSAERYQSDFNNNVNYQLGMAEAPLQVTSAESPYYGTSTSGITGANNALTQLGIASYGPWNSLIQGIGGAASAALGPGGIATKSACWIAEALYGVDDPRTHLLRSWLNNEFKKHLAGRMVMALYVRFGERIAARVRKSPILAAIVKPVFNLALTHAMSDRLIEAF